VESGLGIADIGVGGGGCKAQRHREETSCTPGDSFPLQNKYSKRAKL
jgi:hypothetical protein